MKGIERLRDLVHEIRVDSSVWWLANDDYCKKHGLSGENDGGPLKRLLLEIADQIERETARNADEREAAAWVREHGGIDECERKAEASIEVGDKYTLLRMELGKLLGYDLMGQLDAADEELVEKIGKRLMPSGVRLPKDMAGKTIDPSGPVWLGDEKMAVVAVSHKSRLCLRPWSRKRGGGGGRWYESSRVSVKRPAPRVLDADGEEIRVGDVVYEVGGDGRALHVFDVCPEAVDAKFASGHVYNLDPKDLTHRAPVLAADGRPLREGETVWHEDGTQLRVTGFGDEEDGETLVEVYRISGPTDWGECRSLSLTHERPDSWERLEDDTDALLKAESNGKGSYNAANDYCNAHGLGTDGTVWVLVAQDLVRRAKKLAGVS